MSMLVFYAVPLVSLFLCAAGSVAYLLWAALRRPSRQVRWAVIGAGVAVLGYAGAVAYGLAFTGSLRGRPGLQAGEESDSCGAGQRWPNRRQGDSASIRYGGEAVRTGREVSTVSCPG
ncbi:hypothetical protein [Streptomyces sp. NPDC096311]|uniref:hypothetical protein n=1 Tax=Streptomyces sp. NPDC096311 TaxID=3366083 RepID=UPI0037F2EF07